MNRVKFLRLEKNQSQSDLANFLNVTLQTISNYETEKRDMSPDTIIKLANYFDVSTDYLLGNSDERNPVDVSKVQFANHNGIDTTGLDDDEVEELKKQVEYMKWKKQNKEGKNGI